MYAATRMIDIGELRRMVRFRPRPLFFANATDLVDRALHAVDHAEPAARWFVPERLGRAGGRRPSVRDTAYGRGCLRAVASATIPLQPRLMIRFRSSPGITVPRNDERH